MALQGNERLGTVFQGALTDPDGRLVVVGVNGGSVNTANGTPGSAAPGTATLVGGSDGANLRDILVDSNGRVVVLPATANAVVTASGSTAVATVSVSVVGANATRLGGNLKNRAGSSELYVCLAGVATTGTAFLTLDGGQSWDFLISETLWRGAVSVICAAGGAANYVFGEV